MSDLTMSPGHHSEAGQHQTHHDIMHKNIQMMEDHKISETDSTANLMSDPIHHHLAESAGDSHTMMQMFFHGGCDEVILFDWWRINTYAGLVASMFACVILAILYEVLKVYREHVIYRSNRSQIRRRQKRYNQASNQAHHNTSSEGLSPSSNGINQIINEDGDAEIDIIEERGSSSSAVASEQVGIIN